MKVFRLWFVVVLFASLGYPVAHASAQEREPLEPEWLARDFRSVELVSLLNSPSALTVQRISDILHLGDSGEVEEFGFDATTFELVRGNGYTSLYVEGLVFKGNIGVYKVGIRASSDSWPRIRERVIDLWKHNRGPEFTETDAGIAHVSTNEAVLQSYKASVSAALGEMNPAKVPDELKQSFDYLTSPLSCRAVGGRDGTAAIFALINANRVDLIENVLRGFSPSGRIYAALALLKLNKRDQLTLSPDTISTIEKIKNLEITITTVNGCLVSHPTANKILSEEDWLGG